MARTPATATKWTDFAAVYDRFKVHGMRLRLFLPTAWAPADSVVPSPNVQGFQNAFTAALAVYYDNDGDLAISFGGAADYSSARFYSVKDEVVYQIKSLPIGKLLTDGTPSTKADSAWTDIGDSAELVGALDAWISVPIAPGPATAQITVIEEWDVEFQEMAG